MIVWDGSIAEMMTTIEFFEMEYNRDKAHNGFDSSRWYSFESTSDLECSSSLHFVEIFDIVWHTWTFEKPELESVCGNG